MSTTFPPRRILVPVDLSGPSLTALREALELSRRFRARLEAVYVEEPEPVAVTAEGVPFTSIIGVAKATRDFEAQWRRRLERELAGLEPSPRLVACPGEPAAEIVRLADPRACDLIVMGTHGRSGGRRFFMGSVAEAVIHRARVPVLALREGASLSGGAVLAPCRLTRYADQALLYALELARGLGLPVAILYVAAPDETGADVAGRVRFHVKEVFGASLAAQARIVVRRGGDAREAILREAGTGEYCLLALSAHQRSTLSDLALGSTAERLLRRSRLPLLTVPAQAQARRAAEAGPLRRAG